MANGKTGGSFRAERWSLARRPKQPQREIREELATEIAVESLLTTVDYDYPKFHLTMHCYLCKVKRGSLTLLEHEAAKWLTRDELGSVKWLPADDEVVDIIKTREHVFLKT